MMKKQIPLIVLAALCIVLSIGLYTSKQECAQLKHQLAEFDNAPSPADPVKEDPADIPIVSSQPEKVDSLAAEAEEPVAQKEDSGRRMMKNMALMMENPTMNKVMEASQRGAVGALYADMIEYLDLTPEEMEYFVDLLMYRQMKQVDVSMKIMGGGLTDEETQAMKAELEEVSDTVQTEMEAFLNSDEDYEEFEFYEKTMGERMMLSQMDQSLSNTDAPLTDEQYRDLLGMMNDEKAAFDFTSDLHDDENMDLSAERFSQENIERFSNDMEELHRIIIERAGDMLTEEQLAALVQAIEATAKMQSAQLEMAAQMFGGEEQPAAP